MSHGAYIIFKPLLVAGVPEAVQGEEFLLDRSRAGESHEDIGTASFVVGSTRATATE